ncbi:class I SAM-dependent methyltransferase, partial [Micromonospora sp. NPDC049799]|uniref:class I SAM-dependent DNA methyltransferase n=1 Tax=Micromonospora sp. NPDC049799 TaxID=3154741 RepID=UPI0033C7D6C6
MSADLTTTAEDAAALLRAHPWVGDARAGGAGLRLAVNPAALTAGARPGALMAEFLDQWGEVYDATYRAAAGRHADELDLSGWRATDTGAPLPVEHMRQWADRTVDLILATGPRHVLELGCGTGLLLHRLRPHVTGYVGTDVAPHAVATLAADTPPHVRVVRAAAHELDGTAVRAALADLRFPDGRPDCVVLNSVTQCFPDVGYLSSVLGAAVALVAPGGTVVVGDVRHAGLHEHFCRWVERSTAPEATDEEVRERAARRAARDEELLVTPSVIAAAAVSAGRDVRVGVHARTMADDTELTRYRFDAVLHVEPGPVAQPVELDWSELPEADRLVPVRRLADGPTRIGGIPHALLRAGDESATTPYRLCESTGGRAAVLLDPYRPDVLELASPGAATRPAAEVAAG